MGEKARKLTHTAESIQTESKKKVSLDKRQLQEKDKLSESSRKTSNLRKERDETRKQLELKEQELHFLRQKERHQRDNLDLRVVIAEKETEIRYLKAHTLVKDHEMILERGKHEELRKRLKRTTVDLAKQFERVRKLERSRAELERERRRVDTRIMLETARREVGIT